jgi:hypothetical protein
MADIDVINGVAKYSYQGPSPDEVALVKMAQEHGFEYIHGSDNC